VLDLTGANGANTWPQVFESYPIAYPRADQITGFSVVNQPSTEMGMPPETSSEHVAEFLGWEGFEQTAKAYFDRCFRERKSVTQSGSTNLGPALPRGNAIRLVRPTSERWRPCSRSAATHRTCARLGSLARSADGLAHANRVTTMGELAASIAHEVTSRSPPSSMPQRPAGVGRRRTPQSRRSAMRCGLDRQTKAIGE